MSYTQRQIWGRPFRDLHGPKAVKKNVKTPRSRKDVDRVVRAEETVAHGKNLHPNQTKLAARTLVLQQPKNRRRRTSGNEIAKFTAAKSGGRQLRHKEASRQLYTGVSLAATPVNSYTKGEFVKRLFQAI